MNCTDHYSDYLVRCPDGIIVNAVANAGPYAALRWQLTDKFNNEYTGEVITNGNGGFTIPEDEFPGGMLNQYAGDFELRVLDIDNECRPVPLLVAGYYEAIRFHVKGGTREKDNLGCSFAVVIGGATGGLTNDYFAANGVQVEYNTTSAFIPGQEMVYVGGLLYGSEQYTITGANEITFNEAPPDGVAVRITY